MLLAEEILELLEKRYPNEVPIVELVQFEHGKNAGIRQIINEIRAEILYASIDTSIKKHL